MKRALPLLSVPVAVAVVAIAGCGGGAKAPASGGAGASTGYGAAPASRAGHAMVDVRSTQFGRILVDGRGRTLYLFEKDRRGASACSGACASAWPPLITKGQPASGPGASASLLGTTKRPDGTLQATYAKHPLYDYAGDSGPGQATGEGLDQFGAEWYVLAPSGHKVEEPGS